MALRVGPDPGPPQDCVGGTGESLTLTASGHVVLRGDRHHCGGRSTGGLIGDLTLLKQALQELFGGRFRDLLR